MSKILLSAIALLTGALPAGAAAAVTERRITGAGVDIRVVESGPAERTAILFVPGWGMTADVWRKQVEYFGTTRRVIAIDPRGQGGSGGRDSDVSPEARAADIAVLLDRLGVDRAILVGWSLGVQDVAAYLEAAGSAHISSVVLVDAIPSGGPGGAAADPALERNLGFMQLFLTAPEAYARGMLGAIFRQPLPEDDRRRLLAGMKAMSPASGAASMMSGLYGRDRTAAIRSLCLPVMIVAADGPGADHMHAFAASLPAGRFERIKDAGHALFFDRPDAFNTLLESFVDQPQRPDCAAAKP